MRRRQFQSHTVDFLFTLSLFCVFAVCAFLVVSMVIKVYRSTARYLEDTYSARTALSYVTDEIDGSIYETYIYPDGGYLCELVVRQGTEVFASMGQQILQAEDFAIEDLGEGFLRFTVPDSRGQVLSFLLHLRNTEGGGI